MVFAKNHNQQSLSASIEGLIWYNSYANGGVTVSTGFRLIQDAVVWLPKG